MKISVVVPVYNSAGHLPTLLAALRAQSLSDFELIVADNGSSDASRSIAEDFLKQHPSIPGKVIHAARRGAGAARNAGAREAQGEWIVFTDADCEPIPKWLEELSKEMNDESLGALAGQIIPSLEGSGLVQAFLSAYTLPPYAQRRKWGKFDLLSGGFPTANFAVRRALFLDLEGFDESIRIYGEDYDLCDRIYRAGKGILSLTNAAVRHHHRSTAKGLLRQSFGFGRSHPYLLRRQARPVWLIEAPLVRLRMRGILVRIWLDFRRADKKFLATLVPGFFWTPLWGLPVVYGLFLCWQTHRYLKRRKVPVSFWKSPGLAMWLLLKSLAMTAGAVVGSFRYGVICA